MPAEDAGHPDDARALRRAGAARGARERRPVPDDRRRGDGHAARPQPLGLPLGGGRRRLRCAPPYPAHRQAGTDGAGAALNPDPHNLPKLDPKDQFLLGDATLPFTAADAPAAAGPAAPSTNHLFIPWLRKTEYIGREVRTAAPAQPAYVSPPLVSAQLTPVQEARARGGGRHLARRAAALHRGDVRGRERRPQRARAPDQAGRARGRGVRPPPRRGHLGERVRPLPLPGAARRPPARRACPAGCARAG
jgi:hypothetical protein